MKKRKGPSEGYVPSAVEILGGGLIAPEVMLGALKDKDRHEEERPGTASATRTR